MSVVLLQPTGTAPALQNPTGPPKELRLNFQEVEKLYQQNNDKEQPPKIDRPRKPLSNAKLQQFSDVLTALQEEIKYICLIPTKAASYAPINGWELPDPGISSLSEPFK